MKLYYDLHIHSVLSACADELMTPNNILNMCMLKGLDVVAVCDHNSCKQLPILDQLKNSYDFLFIYGVEVTVAEGFHVLVYFEHLEEAMIFDAFLEKNNKKMAIENTKNFKQIVCDIYDEESSQITYNLHNPISASCEEVIQEAKKNNGVVVFAHIHRTNTGVIHYIEDISNWQIDGVENPNNEAFLHCFQGHPVYYNSDAHTLMNIQEKTSIIDVDERRFNAIFRQKRMMR